MLLGGGRGKACSAPEPNMLPGAPPQPHLNPTCSQEFLLKGVFLGACWVQVARRCAWEPFGFSPEPKMLPGAPAQPAAHNMLPKAPL